MARDDDDGTSAAGTWLELSVTADQEAVEVVSGILSGVAPGGVSVEVPFSTELEGLAAQLLPDAPATMRAYLPTIDPVAADLAIARVREQLGHLTAFELRPIGQLQVRSVHEEDWASAWKEHFPVMRIGKRMVIRPTWRDYEPQAEDVVIALDPGMAFGTGLHPTTRLCLAGLERWDDAGLVHGSSALDVGSGSGILAVGAAILGAAPVLAVDTDPIAVAASAENARRNDVTITTGQGSVPLASDETYDLVLANLVASLLVALAAPLAAVLRPGDGTSGSGGRLLASGIFIDREPEVREAFEAVGLRVLSREQETDWVVLEAGATRRVTIPPSLFPVLLTTHVILAISLFVPAFLLPFTMRTKGTDGEPMVGGDSGRFVRTLVWLEAHGTLIIGGGVAITGIAMLVVLGGALLDQPWLLIALSIYATVLIVAFFIQRPGIRRLLGLRQAATEEEKERWRIRARRQRYVSYLMAGAIGLIGWLMMSKPTFP